MGPNTLADKVRVVVSIRHTGKLMLVVSTWLLLTCSLPSFGKSICRDPEWWGDLLSLSPSFLIQLRCLQQVATWVPTFYGAEIFGSYSRGSQEFKNYPGSIFSVKALATPPLLPSKQGMFLSKNGMFFPPFFWRNFWLCSWWAVNLFQLSNGSKIFKYTICYYN